MEIHSKIAILKKTTRFDTFTTHTDTHGHTHIAVVLNVGLACVAASRPPRVRITSIIL